MGVHTLGRDDRTQCHGPSSCDASSFSNDDRTYTDFEKADKQHIRYLNLEDGYEQLKRQEQEWKLKAEHAKEEADGKAEVAVALKKEIATLVVKLQEEQREKLREQERYKLVKVDFEELSKNLEWHKKQLYECQVARDRAQKDLDEEKQCSPKSTGKVKGKVNPKENQAVLPAGEFIELSHSINSLSGQSLSEDQQEERYKWGEEEKAYWQAMVAELEGQVTLWKNEAGLLSDSVTKSERERATWLGMIAELQKQLEEQVTNSERYKSKLKDMECMLAEEEGKRRVAELEREESRAALKGVLKEKTDLDGAVECIRDDFERVRKSFEKMKYLLSQREKELADMKAFYGKNKAEEMAEKHAGSAKELKVLDFSLQKGVESQVSKDLNDDKVEQNVEDVSEPSKISESSKLGKSTCCLASMEHVDLEWRQKHRNIVRELAEELSHKQMRLVESGSLQGSVLHPAKGSRLPLLEALPPFPSLPVPSSLNDSVIMQLINKGQEVIEKSNSCSMSTLKFSLLSLEEEVGNLENKIRSTFLSEHKEREAKGADIIVSAK